MVFEQNNKIRKCILQAIDGLSDEEFNTEPSNGGWSPKQILEHLALTESRIAKAISRELKNPDSRQAIKKPILFISNRLIKLNALQHTVPSNEFQSVIEIKEALHQSRIYLLDIYDTSNKKLLRQKSLKHPYYGYIPLIQWFYVVGYHEKRHLKQLKKTIQMLKIEGSICPSTTQNLQKKNVDL